MPPSAPSIPRTLQYLWLGFFVLAACGGVVAAVYITMQDSRITNVHEQELATDDEGVVLGEPDVVSKSSQNPSNMEGRKQVTPAPDDAPQVYKTLQNPRVTEVRGRVSPALKAQLATDGFALGNPAFIRIVKEERELELWMKPKGSTAYRLWKKWPIAAMSGRLGPKQKEGDRQAPEGFYRTNSDLLNPASSYHLSFNIGYPNAYDRAHGRTGNFLMVHGNQVSVGCFAMTDPVIEEIYLVVESAIQAGQKEVPVHVYPFRMTDERMLRAETEESEWLSFWKDLREGWMQFEETKAVPRVKVDAVEKRYVVMK